MEKGQRNSHSMAGGQGVHTILVAEDDEALLELIQKRLRRAGFQAEGVLNGSEAIERVANNPPALLLLDYRLPDISGNQVVEALGARNCSVPFIVITGQGDERVAVKMMKLGARDYLVKDSSFLDRLSRVVELVMGQLATERELAETEKVLKGSESRYRAVFENTGTAMLIIEEDMTISLVNEEFVKLCGYSREEVEGNKSWTEFVAGEDLERMKEYHKSRRVGPRSAPRNYEFRFVDKKRNIRDAFITVSMIPGTKKSVASLLDITESKRAEQALRESEEKFRTFMETASDLIHITDKDGNFTYVNESMARTLGYSREEMIGMHITQFLSEQSLEGFEQRTEELIRQGKITHEPVWVTKEGKKIYLEMKVVAVYDGDGKYAGSRGISRDITERKRVAEELRLRAQLLDAAIDSIFLHDFNGNMIYVNETFYRFHGYSREEMMGMSLRQLGTPQYDRLIGQRLRQVEEEGSGIFETAHLHKDGSVLPMEVHSRVVESGGRKLILTVGRDITERKKMEEELELSALLLDSVQDAVNLSDFDGNIVYVNETACTSLGYSREDLLKMKLGDLDAAGYAHALKWRNQELTKKKHTIFETANIRKDGSVIPVEVHSQFVEVGGKELVLSIDRDITERKQMEAERKEMEQKAQLASRLASVGEMASGIAHEINNPLVGVIGFAQLLMERKDLPDDVREELKIISEGGQRVSNIVKGMLSFARQRKPERTYVDINQIIETTLKLRTYEIETASIQVVIQLDPDLPGTMADAGQLQQVFLNLVINAEKEMVLAHGRGKLVVKTAVIDRTIRISFKDDGSGIGKKNLDRIFDPFFTTREAGQGTGLGLSICHGIMAEHNGRIYAESKPGKGATFIVELPVISEEKQMEMAETAEDVNEKVARANILVVDDEPTNLQYLNELLTQEGHGVETADNAGDALKMIERGGYDLILLDIKMPGMSGMELYKRIQKTVPSLAGRVVFITGDVKGTDTVEFLFRAEVPYVTKPFDSKKLKKIINHILTG